MEKYALVVMNYQGFGENTLRSVVCRSVKWAGKLSFVTGSVMGSTGNPHFEIEKKIHRSHPNRS